MSKKDRFRVLVVDKDPAFRRQLSHHLREHGYLVKETASGETALNWAEAAFRKRDRTLTPPPSWDYDSGATAAERRFRPTPTKRYDFSDYDLIVYDAQTGETSYQTHWDNFLAEVREKDMSFPVMVTGPRDEELAVRAVSAGALGYVAKSRSTALNALITQITNMLTLSVDVGPVKVVKFGGSSFDQDDDNETTYNNLEVVVDCSARYFHSGGNLIFTTGAGRFGDAAKRFLAHYGHVAAVVENFHDRLRQCIELNVEDICDTFGDLARYVTQDEFATVTRQFLREHIAVMPFAPTPIYRKHGISFGDSDVQTIATAVFYGAKELILIKDTDGVYEYDPLLGSLDGPTAWMKAQKGNRRLKNVTARTLLGIKREGAFDKQGNHLIEDNAIRYWLDHAPQLKAIYIVPISPEKMFVKDPRSYGKKPLDLRHVVDPSIEFMPLEEHLSSALNGRGYKITRE